MFNIKSFEPEEIDACLKESVEKRKINMLKLFEIICRFKSHVKYYYLKYLEANKIMNRYLFLFFN